MTRPVCPAKPGGTRERNRAPGTALGPLPGPGLKLLSSRLPSKRRQTHLTTQRALIPPPPQSLIPRPALPVRSPWPWLKSCHLSQARRATALLPSSRPRPSLCRIPVLRDPAVVGAHHSSACAGTVGVAVLSSPGQGYRPEALGQDDAGSRALETQSSHRSDAGFCSPVGEVGTNPPAADAYRQAARGHSDPRLLLPPTAETSTFPACPVTGGDHWLPYCQPQIRRCLQG